VHCSASRDASAMYHPEQARGLAACLTPPMSQSCPRLKSTSLNHTAGPICSAGRLFRMKVPFGAPFLSQRTYRERGRIG
jgi:hypothetical protein